MGKAGPTGRTLGWGFCSPFRPPGWGRGARKRGVPSLLAKQMSPMVQQKHFHCGLCYFLFCTHRGPTLGLPGARRLPLGGDRRSRPGMFGHRAREGRGRGVPRERRGAFAMFVLLRALFPPSRWLDATWLLRSCCRVESVFFFNVRIPANVAQIKFKLEVNRRGGGGGEGGGRLFPFRDPTSSLRGDQRP